MRNFNRYSEMFHGINKLGKKLRPDGLPHYSEIVRDRGCQLKVLEIFAIQGLDGFVEQPEFKFAGKQDTESHGLGFFYDTSTQYPRIIFHSLTGMLYQEKQVPFRWFPRHFPA